ncbi:MAG TPA: hypothetical protein VM490_11680 [Armatimonadaceae bacterium]|nr:hypothetical protein [Armatimonadaceae bacterium]
MKKDVSPAVAVAVIIAVVVVVAGFLFVRAGRPPVAPAAGAAGSGAAAMPPQVTAELQKRMGGVQPPRAAGQ